MKIKLLAVVLMATVSAFSFANSTASDPDISDSVVSDTVASSTVASSSAVPKSAASDSATTKSATSNSVASDSGTYIDTNIGLNTSWNSVGLNVNAGYMLNRYVGLEGGVTFSPGYSYTNSNASYNTSYYAFDGAVKGVLPLSEMFSLYGKLGINYNHYANMGNYVNLGGTYYKSNVSMLAAAGVEFNLTNKLSLHLEDMGSVSGANPNLLMVGAEFKF